MRYLAERGHQIYLVSFMRPDEEPFVASLREVCTDVHAIPIHRSRLADIGYMFKSFLTRRPFLIERDDLHSMRQCVQELTENYAFDFIHADQLSMAQFALSTPGIFGKLHSRNRITGMENGLPRLVFDAHNAVWKIVERLSQTSPWYLQPILRAEARRVKNYEGLLLEVFDHTLAVTDIDRRLLLEALPAKQKDSMAGFTQDLGAEISEKIKVIPIAIDSQVLIPVKRKPASPNLITLGTLHYPPNADGIRWFIHEVFPGVCRQVPGARLTIVGKNPPADFIELAASQPERVTVTGYVPDLVPYFEEAALMIVPVRAGSGMRVRILEAFAQAMPVITTTVGLEGIDAIPEEDVLIADSPDDFVAQVVRLMQDEALQGRLAANGRRLAETRYDWQIVLKLLDQVYASSHTRT